jgi:hypothetical protein
MYLDAQTQICTEQAFSSDAVSENTYDCGVAGRDVAEGEPLALVIVPTVAADFTTGDETYEFKVIEDDDPALGSFNVLIAQTIAASALTVGSKHVIPIPPGKQTLRYLGMYFNGGGTTPTITLDAWIVPLSMAGSWKAYADNVTIQ